MDQLVDVLSLGPLVSVCSADGSSRSDLYDVTYSRRKSKLGDWTCSVAGTVWVDRMVLSRAVGPRFVILWQVLSIRHLV